MIKIKSIKDFYFQINIHNINESNSYIVVGIPNGNSFQTSIWPLDWT